MDYILIVFGIRKINCLETIYEIGTEYQEIFEKHGGQKIQLVGSLNSGDDWVETIKKITLQVS